MPTETIPTGTKPTGTKKLVLHQETLWRLTGSMVADDPLSPTISEVMRCTEDDTCEVQSCVFPCSD